MTAFNVFKYQIELSNCSTRYILEVASLLPEYFNEWMNETLKWWIFMMSHNQKFLDFILITFNIFDSILKYFLHF